ncbi:MAG: hypothetical protein HY898_07645 [Deltaproteobacteria bacterium]|nr:hypothetical protein [Deltaproteobacteria bacterium]
MNEFVGTRSGSRGLRPRWVVFLAAATFAAMGCSSSGSTEPTPGVGGSGGSSTDAPVDAKGGAAGTAGTAGMGGTAGGGGTGGVKDSGPSDAPTDTSLDTSLDGAGGTAGTGGSGDGSAKCQNDTECVGNAAGPYCDKASGACVECKPADPSTCQNGMYCDSTTIKCTPGCDTADDCTAGSDAGAMTCDPNTHKCVGCTDDTQCPLGLVCKSNSCEPGCTPQHGCQTGFDCCSSKCINTGTDVQNCGACGYACNIANATSTCLGGKCGLEACLPGFENCDQVPANGCETPSGDGGACSCVPNATQPCYSGPPGTENVGPCKGGTQTCNSTGTAWGACMGEVLPTTESCYTPVDDDCNGQTNESGPGCVCVPQSQEPCYNGPPSTRNVGACQDGTHVCNLAGTAWGGCIGEVLPTPETCLTPVDDNCNGEVNEAGGAGCQCTPNSTATCYSGPPGTAGVGVCKAGTQTCDSMGTGYGPCQGTVVPSPDVCTDNLDNDCNGTTNDGFSSGANGCLCFPGAVSTCYTGGPGTLNVGACKSGTAQCNAQGTANGPCNGQVVPSTDHCTDAIDNDCNGIVNDGFGKGGAGCACTPGAQQTCYTGPAGTLGKGVCVAGSQTCNADGQAWGPCIGQIIPDVDSCLNSLDDDCNGIVNDGFGKGGAGCTCTPGVQTSCYQGPNGTAGVGPCKAGIATCNATGTGTSACVGQVLPIDEICGNGVNDDCVGGADDPPDSDADGWTRCQGDCCDTTANCSIPALVNPGAFDVPGNNVDDDCDGTIDNGLTTCDGALASNSADPLDYARAIDLCQFTTETPPLNQKKWGVISAGFFRADGTGVPAAMSRSIRPGFGTAIVPKAGARVAVLSTGRAADSNDTNPAFAAFQGGQDMGTSSGVPADWLAANGGVIPNSPGCPAPQGGNVAHDPIMLKIRIRVPTNAQSFSVMPYFFSSEYPEWVCSPYNDFFVSLLNSTFTGNPPNPTDRNLAFYDPAPAGPPYYPVGVNLAFGNTGLFRQCLNGPTGCGGGSVAGNCNTCLGITELAGTGFDTLNPPPQFSGDPGWCGSSNRLGGGTGWLTTHGNVNPGETIEIRFATWDTGDQWYDSLVLLDNWLWSLTAAQPGTSL